MEEAAGELKNSNCFWLEPYIYHEKNFNPNVESSEVTTQDTQNICKILPLSLVFSRLKIGPREAHPKHMWSIHKSGYLNNDATTTTTEH